MERVRVHAGTGARDSVSYSIAIMIKRVEGTSAHGERIKLIDKINDNS